MLTSERSGVYVQQDFPELQRSGNFLTDDNGVYVCQVTGEGSLFIGIYRHPQSLGELNLDIRAEYGEEGGESPRLVLNCSSAGLPATTVSWFFENEEINGTVGDFSQLIPDRINTVYNSLLAIEKEDLRDNSLLQNGQYMCVVQANLTSANASMDFSIGKEYTKSLDIG